MRSALFAAILALAGCGSARPEPQTGPPGTVEPAGAGSDFVCHEVADTGSLITHKECVPVEKTDDDKEDARQMLGKPRSQPTTHH